MFELVEPHIKSYIHIMQHPVFNENITTFVFSCGFPAFMYLICGKKKPYWLSYVLGADATAECHSRHSYLQKEPTTTHV